VSRSPVISLRWISPWLCSLILVATPARSERPRSEQEEMERANRPAPAFALPDHWTPGQPVRFPRQLLPYLMRDMGALEGTIHDPDEEPATVLRALGTAPERRERAPFGGNRIVNDPTLDPPAATQSENTLAVFGRFMVAGWNDSFDPRTPRNFSGFGYSTDGGQTWHDGGILPDAATNDQLFGDPSLTVDHLGNFYYASLYRRPGITLGVAVNRGRFEHDVLKFEPPVLASMPGAHDSFDKEWITADPWDGTLYMSYTRFFDAGGDQIELVRSRDHGRTWSAPVVVSNVATESVQGSRPVVGEHHDVFVVYACTDLSDFNSHMRIRRSTDRGRSVESFVNIGEAAGDVSLYPNFAAGPPGFNRGNGVEFPSIAVNLGEGRHRGDLFVAWNEAVDFFDDVLGVGPQVPETENNGSPAQAMPIHIGDTIFGRLDSVNDLDFYSFSGHAGETVLFFLTPPTPNASGGFLRLFGPGGGIADRLALSLFGGGQAFIVFTLPSDGTYFIRPALPNAQAKPGPYVLLTAFHEPNARDVAADARDVMLSRSKDGVHWTRRERVNDDAPLYDNAFAEVAADRRGNVHLVWYDHRNDPHGVLTDLYHARSQDGGRTFEANDRVNDGPGINWNLVGSQIAPNMGDYISLLASGDDVFTVWADGRLGTSDSWLMRVGAKRHGTDDDELSSGVPVAAATTASDGATQGHGPALRFSNPWRSGTPLTLSFEVSKAGPARLEIFSVTGQRVGTLLDGPVAAGAHQLVWDARGRDGAPASPGLYFAILNTGPIQLRQRVVLLP